MTTASLMNSGALTRCCSVGHSSLHTMIRAPPCRWLSQVGGKSWTSVYTRDINPKDRTFLRTYGSRDVSVSAYPSLCLSLRRLSDREMHVLFGYNTFEGFAFYVQVYSFGKNVSEVAQTLLT